MATLMSKAACVSGIVARPCLPFVVRTTRATRAVSVRASKDQTVEVGHLAGLTVAASLLVAENANAAVEITQLAASDNRLGLIATLFVPALGWVAFNIAQPFFNQMDRMKDQRSSFAAAVGLGAAAVLLLADSASASTTEVAQLAASDNRAALIATLFVPALGWVAFNIAQPFFNQLDRMDKAKSSVAGAVGISTAAALFMADNASASTEIAQLAASDNRLGIIATLFIPALGWVAFNIAQPFFNQLERMKEDRE